MLEIARPVSPIAAKSPVRFTIGSIINDKAQYAEMLASFQAFGFGADDCEYLYVDNSASNQMCCYRGLNRMLEDARGDYIILCHQDVRLFDDGRAELEQRLHELDALDPQWAVAGNAGGIELGKFAVRISDPHGLNAEIGPFPSKIDSLDENFLLLKKSARLSFSRDLEGFHFYGTDICIQADILGYNSYVIDFHLKHLGQGIINETFHTCRRNLIDKYARAFRPRWIQTTCARVYVSGTTFGHDVKGLLRLVRIKGPQKLSRSAGRLAATLTPRGRRAAAQD
jgi:glycosyltransferase involved in cell wall biosynthesis